MTDVSIDTSSDLSRSLGLTSVAMLFTISFFYLIVFVSAGLFVSPLVLPFDGSLVIEGLNSADRVRCALSWHLPGSEYNLRCASYFQFNGAANYLNYIMLCSLLLGVFVGVVTGWKMTKPMQRIHHMRGAKLEIDVGAEAALSKLSSSEPSPHLTPLQITPYFQMSNFRECEHFMVVGGSGSGKTQLLTRLFGEALERGDRLVLHDVKGDFISYLPDAFLLSPTDKRSGIWDIAQDINTPPMAREFIAFLLPHSGKEKIWVNAARSIATGYIVYLQKTKGTKWGWADLAQINTSNFAQLKKIMQDYWREASDFLQKDSVTTQGFISEVKANLYIFTDIANGWIDPDGTRPRVSLRQWMMSPKENQQVLILARNAEFAELSSAWVSAAVHFMCTLGISPNLGESDTRRIWFGMDEFWAMQKQDKISELIRLGRSKGIIVVIGAQSSLQLEEIYGEKVVYDWFNNFGTIIIAKHKAGPAAEKMSMLIGKRTIEKISNSMSGRAGAAQSTSQSIRSEDELIILPSQLSDVLGRFEESLGFLGRLGGKTARPYLRMIVLGYKELVPIVRMQIRDIRKFREGYVPADYLEKQNYRAADELVLLEAPEKLTSQAIKKTKIKSAAADRTPPLVADVGKTSATKKLHSVNIAPRRLILRKCPEGQMTAAVMSYLDTVIASDYPKLFMHPGQIVTTSIDIEVRGN